MCDPFPAWDVRAPSYCLSAGRLGASQKDCRQGAQVEWTEPRSKKSRFISAMSPGA